MKNDPLFSVIIPTYNRAEFISDTIESVLVQSYVDFEVIVVDDGSTDSTSEVVSTFKDDRVAYFLKANEERAAARNAGTNRAKGRFVTFLDSDDILYRDHLEVAAEVARNHGDPEFFHLGYEFFEQNGVRTRPVDSLPKVGNDRLIHGNALSCRGVFVRRDIAAVHQFNTDRGLSGTEDYELWLRLASRYPLYCDNRITSAIVQHDARSVVNTDKGRLVKRIELLEYYLHNDAEFIRRFGDRIGEFKANNRVYIALHLALAGHKTEAYGFLLKALVISTTALKNRAFYGTIKRCLVKYGG